MEIKNFEINFIKKTKPKQNKTKTQVYTDKTSELLKLQRAIDDRKFNYIIEAY
jgi:hypothetical protein